MCKYLCVYCWLPYVWQVYENREWSILVGVILRQRLHFSLLRNITPG